jgi:hypothetical protein
MSLSRNWNYQYKCDPPFVVVMAVLLFVVFLGQVAVMVIYQGIVADISNRIHVEEAFVEIMLCQRTAGLMR